ncbi:hypothetical protein BV22DRAFT_1132849 [Leucogyrophana mollusca]|uniref:Uncharacterized protein n=1 Tax=Leucogyrophana mollusca TaxID=85980 RepID=A0ACB8B4Y7_9AGAM|nr:hypothetical protein BV22DRAFT_1132849 [Leucogyrophana mollusca]
MPTTLDTVAGTVEDLNIIRQTRISQPSLYPMTDSFAERRMVNPNYFVPHSTLRRRWSRDPYHHSIFERTISTVVSDSYILQQPMPSRTTDACPNARLRPHFSCDGFMFLAPWSESVLIWIMQTILQMRIYALYKRSRRVLVFMIATFVMEIIAMSTIMIVVDTGVEIVNNLPPDAKICVAEDVPGFFFAWWLPVIVFEGLLCMFALSAGVRQLVSRTKMEGFRGGRAVDALVKGNVFYFLW